MRSSPVPQMSSSPRPASPPLRSTSTGVKSDYRTPSVSAQSDLQKLLSGGIHDHAWQFNAVRIAEMLSATGKGPTEVLVNSTHEALRETLTGKALGWPSVETKRAWYPPVATFLNNCVDACRDALGGSKSAATKDSRFYDRLKFTVHNRTTEKELRVLDPSSWISWAVWAWHLTSTLYGAPPQDGCYSQWWSRQAGHRWLPKPRHTPVACSAQVHRDSSQWFLGSNTSKQSCASWCSIAVA